MTPGVADHVGVGEVDDPEAVAVLRPVRDEGVGGGAGAHLRLVVVGGDVAGRVDQAALLPLPLLLATAVEEVGDVRVLLGLGDVQLAPAGLGYDLGQGRPRARLGEGDRVGPALAVLGHRGQVEQRAARAGELVEAGLGQGAGHLRGPGRGGS